MRRSAGDARSGSRVPGALGTAISRVPPGVRAAPGETDSGEPPPQPATSAAIAAPRSNRLPAAASIGSDLQQYEGVDDEEDGEEDRPAVQVPLHQRAAADRAAGLADPERSREARVLPRVQQDEEDQDYRDNNLDCAQQGHHRPGSVARRARLFAGALAPCAGLVQPLQD